ncbi:hypothetical protein Nmel_000678 [Mimus melanotis]
MSDFSFYQLDATYSIHTQGVSILADIQVSSFPS